MPAWVLSTAMTLAVASHQPGTASAASTAQSNSQGGIGSRAECERLGEAWRAEILRRHPAAQAQYTCREE